MENFVIKEGTAQAQRYSSTFEPDFISADERSFEDIIKYTFDYAGLIKFYDQNLDVKNDWRTIFASNEIVILSLFVKFDLDRLEHDFQYVFNFRENNKRNYFKKLINQVFDVAERINRLYVHLSRISAFESKNFKNEIEGIISFKLSSEIKKLETFVLAILENEKAFEHFNSIWNLGAVKPVEQDINFDDVTSMKNSLKSLFYNFYNAISYLQKIAPAYLEKSFKAQNHKPDSALFIAFVKLLGKVRDKHNGFTKKHSEFFYNDVLKIESRSYKPDSTYLLFNLSDEVEAVFIPQKTKFLADVDERGKPLFYSNENDVLLCNSNITKLATILFDCDKLIYPANVFDAVTSVKTSEIPVLNIDDPIEGSWPIFGNTRNKQDDGSIDAELGFAIESPSLYLVEGESLVKIVLKLGAENNLPSMLKELADKLEVSKKEIFVRIFSNAFNIRLTGENNWLQITQYMISSDYLDHTKNFSEIVISFKLTAELEKIINYNSEIHGERFDSCLPIASITLNPHSDIYAYTFLEGIRLVQINIKVDVEGIRNLQVYSNLGKLDVSAPFNPFGVMPIESSNFVLGNYQVFRKNIEKLDLSIDWSGLPNNEDGFASYYENYNLPISNSCFKVKISSLKNGNWVPFTANGAFEFELFEYNTKDETEGRLKSKSSFNNLACSQYVPYSKDSEEMYYYNINSQNGFMKIELSDPDFAFGHKEYPFALNNVVMRNARRRKKKDLPNQPYTPLANKIELNYKACSSVNFSKRAIESPKERFFHIHPFGVEKIDPKENSGGVDLIPNCRAKGNLLIGLDKIKANQALTIYYQFHDDAAIDTQTKSLDLQWYYLSNNIWKELSNTKITSDTTNGFLNTGIVTIEMPDDITNNNSIVQENLYWIKASANSNLDLACSLEKMCTKAIEVSWENEGNTLTHLKEGIPEETIEKTQFQIRGLETIYQPIPSFGGVAPEEKPELKRRISERLNHKNRAATAKDYELIVLENFPEIQKVKCFMNMSSKKTIHPGNVLIVVIPVNERGIDYEPMVTMEKLYHIKEKLKKLSSPFAKIEVRNPSYEKVLVRCSVKLKEGLSGGYFIQKLNKELFEYFNPWKTKNNLVAGPIFGSSIRTSDVLGFVQNKEYIELVSNFSMLKVNEAKKAFNLYDTAEMRENHKLEDDIIANKLSLEKVEPSTPWSIIVSAQNHNIKEIHSNNIIKPSITGINDLELGESFIIK